MAGKAKEPVAAGDTAPAFTLTDQAGKPVASKDLAGTPYVLFVYPKASTPG